MSDKRTEARTRTFLKGRIVFNNGSSTFDCLVRDMSSTGAKLVLTEAATLPDIFDLHILNKGAKLKAHIRWRRADQIGVRFVDAEVQPQDPWPDAEKRIRQIELENAGLREEIDRLEAELEQLRLTRDAR